jgi:hypothetical protein
MNRYQKGSKKLRFGRKKPGTFCGSVRPKDEIASLRIPPKVACHDDLPAFFQDESPKTGAGRLFRVP